MYRGVSKFRDILPRIQISRFSPPGLTKNGACRDFSLAQDHRRSAPSYGSDGNGSNDGAVTGRNLATVFSPRICLTWPREEAFSLLSNRRDKSTKAKGGKRSGHAREKKAVTEEFSDDDSDCDIELESGLDFRDMRVKVPSSRLDAVLKAGLKMSRNKVEAAFYASKIHVNGEKTLKKSKQVHEGDELDVIKGVSNINQDMLDISRIVILRIGKYDEDLEKYNITLRKYPQLLVPKNDDLENEVDAFKTPH